MEFFKDIFGGPPYRLIMPKDAFQPQNALEEVLASVVGNPAQVTVFIELLRKSQIFAPSPAAPEALQQGKGFALLVFDHPEHGKMVAVFTSADRLTPVAELFRAAQSALLVEFTWVLAAMPQELGIVINPGWEVGLEMPAAGLAELRLDWAQSGRQGTGIGKIAGET